MHHFPCYNHNCLRSARIHEEVYSESLWTGRLVRGNRLGEFDLNNSTTLIEGTVTNSRLSPGIFSSIHGTGS